MELIGLKEASARTHMPIRWAHSDAQLANSLTKDSEQQQLQRFYHLGQVWRIIDDPLMRSGRNRKKAGIGPMENTTNGEETGETNLGQWTRGGVQFVIRTQVTLVLHSHDYGKCCGSKQGPSLCDSYHSHCCAIVTALAVPGTGVVSEILGFVISTI